MSKVWYLATEYSRFPGGIEAAFRMACAQTARLMRAGVPVFSPIAHTHGVAVHGGIDPLDVDTWLKADAPHMHAARGCIVYRSPTWQTSRGVAHEIDYFKAALKPVVYLDPEPADLPAALKNAAYEWSRRVWSAGIVPL